MAECRVAVLVDGDNISAVYSARILDNAGSLGRVDLARVYCATNKKTEWLTKPGYRMIHAGTGKNAADLLLSIDAMEIAFTLGIHSFVVASSDGDFTHLAQRLRERGMTVLGMGEQKAPLGYRIACSEFTVLEPVAKRVADPSLPTQTPTAPAVAAPPARAAPVTAATDKSPTGVFGELDLKIRNLIATHSSNGKGMRIADLSPRMHLLHGTRISAYPERNWRGYLLKRPALYDVDPRGAEAMVRFRPAGFK